MGPGVVSPGKELGLGCGNPQAIAALRRLPLVDYRRALALKRPVLEAMVQDVTGVKVLSLHHDISTVTGEEVVLFTLAESPLFRETTKK